MKYRRVLIHETHKTVMKSKQKLKYQKKMCHDKHRETLPVLIKNTFSPN